MNVVLRHIRRVALLNDTGALSDRRLLEQFLRLRDEEAFAALVRRHGPMVLAVCRRVLGNAHDAEDAFQATFLVLARKAVSFPRPQFLGGWLHGVAYRTSLKARTMLARRRARERTVRANMTAQSLGPEYDDDMLRLLDQELDRLPDKYRLPIVLFALEGRSRKEVAGQLGISESVLSHRLWYGKKLLAKQLRRTGVCLPMALPALMEHSRQAVGLSAKLVNETTQAALQVASGQILVAGTISAHVIGLAQGVMKAMLLNKLKAVAIGILAFAVAAGGLGLTYQSASAQNSDAPRKSAQSDSTGDGLRAARATRDELEELRLEIAALRKGLQATREQVKGLQEELERFKGQSRVQIGTTRLGDVSGSLDFSKNPPTSRIEVHFPPGIALTSQDGVNSLNNRAWEVVKQPGREMSAYRKALGESEEACRLQTENGDFLNTLGVAYYRVGDYEKALTTLLRSDSIDKGRFNGSTPFDLAFLCMTQKHLGHVQEAKSNFKQLRERMQESRWAQNTEAQEFLREAETLLGKSGPKK
jgi:RNA polymerase sigma factor (sigma-70 family)